MPSMYRASVPVFSEFLSSLSDILGKAEAHCEAHQIEPGVLMGYRLAPDMYPLSRQVQMASYLAKIGVARLAGVEPPDEANTETTFAELTARVSRIFAYVRSFPPEQIDGSDEREIRFSGNNDVQFRFTGQQYLMHFVLPHFFFHLVTTYDILRHAGVELGKRDYLGDDPAAPVRW